MRLRATHALAGVTLAASVAACVVDRAGPTYDDRVHPIGFADPTSPSAHAAVLRAKRWAPMLDADDDEACGRCHAGAPATPSGVTSSAPGAPSCTSCHASPGGPLACTTCHGDPPTTGAHAAHVLPSAASATGFACSTCHPMPGASVIGGTHGDGSVEIVFARPFALGEASYDATTKQCAVSCHDVGGARARPAWTDATPMTCGDCHGAPPAGHFEGACNGCHAEANANGTALSRGPLHLNGRVDLGDGSGTCAACHGANGDPWPTTNAHPAHARPTIASPVACGSCHVVPSDVLSPGHLDGQARVTFGGHALDRGAQPSYANGTCVDVACHGAALAEPPSVTPTWTDASHAASACGACHGIPPTQHTASTSCGRSDCHSGEVAGEAVGALSITPSGLPLHVDGVIEHASR